MQIQVSLTIEIEANASLAQMEDQIQEAGQQAMQEALKQTIKQWEDQRKACAPCGSQQRRLEGTVRRVIATKFGRVEVQRRRFRCLGCGRRGCPANELFQDLQGGTISQPLQEAAMLAGCSWPYRVASGLLKAQISAEEMSLLTNEQGKQRAAQQQKEAEQRCTDSTGSTPAAQQPAQQEQPMLVGIDGGGCAVGSSARAARGSALTATSIIRDSRYLGHLLRNKSAARGTDGEGEPMPERRDEVMPEPGRSFELGGCLTSCVYDHDTSWR